MIVFSPIYVLRTYVRTRAHTHARTPRAHTHARTQAPRKPNKPLIFIEKRKLFTTMTYACMRAWARTHARTRAQTHARTQAPRKPNKPLIFIEKRKLFANMTFAHCEIRRKSSNNVERPLILAEQRKLLRIRNFLQKNVGNRKFWDPPKSVEKRRTTVNFRRKT
jgi:hypothetical protein